MNNFNYNNYIGEHMSEPLCVIDNREKINYVESWNYKTNELCLITIGGLGFFALDKDYKPLIKSPSDLTDEEVKYILCDDEEFENGTWKIIKDEDCTEVDTYIGCWHDESDSFHFLDYYNPKLTQNQFNRLYSLHVSLDYDELIKNNKAVRKI